MAEPLDDWSQTRIESLEPGGEPWHGDVYSAHRYRDGWHFYWKCLSRVPGLCSDLGRFFDEDHIWEMRNFMAGKWDRGIRIVCPDAADWMS